MDAMGGLIGCAEAEGTGRETGAVALNDSCSHRNHHRSYPNYGHAIQYKSC